MKDLRISIAVRPWALLALACIATFINQHAVRSTEIASGECDVRFTHCGPLCSPIVTIQPDSNTNETRVSCRCDRRCALYGDCCVDYSEHCVNETHPPVVSSRFSSYFKCVTPLDERNILESFVVVGSCPAEWPRDTVRNNCENESLARSQKFLTMLVNGPDEIVFKNVFCAVCHGIPDDQLDPWHLSLSRCYKLAGTTLFNFDRCASFIMSPPSSVSSSPHHCYPNVIDSCSPNATESQTALCENSTSRVFTIIEGVAISYKNRHCVACNVNLGKRILCRVSWRPLFDPSISFTLLFDFTELTVMVEQSFIPGQQPRILGSCSSWQIYDPFLNVCRDLRCPIGGTRLNTGVCVNAAVKDIPNINHSSQTCLQHFLSQVYTLDSAHNFTSNDIVQGNIIEAYSIEIHVDFLVAVYFQWSLEQIIFDNDTCFPCNATSLSVLAFSRVGTNDSWLPTLGCEGVTVDNIKIDEITLSDGVYSYNSSGVVYHYQAMELMHLTMYNQTANRGSIETSRQSYLRLCSPFGNSCPVAVFNRNEFVVLGSGQDTVFVHKATEKSFHSDDVWQLPDQTLRICEFLLDNESPPTWLTKLATVSFIGSVCSLISLSLSLLTFVIFPVLQNQPGKIIMNLMVAFILAQAVLMVGKVSVHCLCVMRAALLHFSWLAVFVWMTVMASDLAKSITSKSPPDQRSGSSFKVVKLGIVAWGTPTIFVCACYLISRLSEDQSWGWLEYGGDQCWIVDPFHSLLAFGVPVAVLLIINCMLAVFMIYKVSSNRRRLAAAQISCNLKTELLLCFKLIVITGVTWSLFFAANLVNSPILWYIVVVVNSLQGALIGMLFLLKKRMMTLWRNKLTVIFCISCRRRHRKKKGAEPSPVNLVTVTVTSGDAPQMQDERPEIDKLQ